MLDTFYVKFVIPSKQYPDTTLIDYCLVYTKSVESAIEYVKKNRKNCIAVIGAELYRPVEGRPHSISTLGVTNDRDFWRVLDLG